MQNSGRLDFIHPLVQLEKLLMEKDGLDIINALFAVMPVSDQDELTTSLVLIFGHNEADFTLLKWALALEIAETGAVISFACFSSLHIQSLLHLFVPSHRNILLMQNVLVDAEGTLFRGAHLAQKLVSVYCRTWGLVYLFRASFSHNDVAKS